MKSLLRWLPCLLVFPCLAQPQTASVTAYCRSLCLSPVIASYGGGTYFNVTTVKGTPGQLNYFIQTNGTRLYSGELRLVPGRSSLYAGDFELTSGNSPIYDGSFTLAFTNLASSGNNLPPMLDPAQSMYCEAIGSGATSWPASNRFRLNLRFSRAAGTTNGAFSGVWTINNANYILNGSARLMLLQGSASYTRGRTNQLQFCLTRSLLDGTSNTTTLTGAVAYTASRNQISLPRFYLADTQGRTYTALHTVLSRHGNQYRGSLKLVDGAPETPWPDYLDWILAITDANDADGNGIPDISDPSAVVIPSAPLVLTTHGPGTVSPALGGQNLELGKTYRLTANPDTGYLFNGWSGDILSSSRTIVFTMQTNLNLQVSFAPNPFYPVRGAYYGLIQDTQAPANQTLGAFTATTTESGTYSAKFRLGGQTYSVSGAFDATGSTYPVIVPANLRTLFVQLHLDLTNHTGISGSIGDGTWTASIAANKSPFKARSNPCAFAGKYTFAIPSWGGYGEPPLGHSYGTVTVDTAGHVRCSAWLADGTRATQSTMLSGTGDWPFYLSLYGRKGCLAGWLTFTNLAGLPEMYGVPFSGVSAWVKPAATTKLAPEGFTNQVNILLSEVPAAGSSVPLLTWTNGVIGFSTGNLESTFQALLLVGSHNKLASASTNKLTLRLRANGLFQGRVTPPGASRPVSFQGALVQQMGSGFGYWLGSSKSGTVDFGALMGGPGQPPTQITLTNVLRRPGVLTNLPIPGLPTLTNDAGVVIVRNPPLPPRPPLPPMLVTNIIVVPLTNNPPVLVTNIPIQLNTGPQTYSSSGVVIQRATSANLTR